MYTTGLYNNGVKYEWGKESGWKPGANTILSIPFKTDLIDHGPNNISLTKSGTVTLDSQGANFSSKSAFRGSTPSPILGDFTFSSWIKPENGCGIQTNIIQVGEGYPGHGYRYGANGANGYIGFTLTHVIDWNYTTRFSTLYGSWHNIMMVRSGTANTLYLDGVSKGTYGGTSNPSSSNFIVCGDDASGHDTFIGHINHLIVENKARTAQEITDYYNLTKKNYGL